jgi:hypothetical protein
MNWFRLSRFFHLEGNLGALRFEARGGIFDLNAVEPIVFEKEIADTPKFKVLVSSWANQRSILPALQVWEWEGGTVGQPR